MVSPAFLRPVRASRACGSSTSKGRRPVQAFLGAATVFVIASLMFASAAGAVGAIGADLEATGAEEILYDWSEDRCDDHHISDVPARAFRDHMGQSKLMMGTASFPGTPQTGGTRRMLGINGDLTAPTVDCRQLHFSDHRNDPASYDNWEWLHGEYSPDGQKVYALVHDEYHAWDTPDNCGGLSAFRLKCWYNAITFASSNDKGDTFTHAATPGHFVGTIPYRYQEPPSPIDEGGLPVGYFEPSNILKGTDGAYYSMFLAIYPAVNGVYEQGTCVMRTNNLADRTSWRSYGDGNGDGTLGYEVQAVDPYRASGFIPERHKCKPVSVPQISIMHQSLSYNRHLQKYMLVGIANNPITPTADYDVYYSLSSDLINWEQRKPLMDASFHNEGCVPGDPQPIFFPGALDRNSTSRNYETTGRSFDFYFTQFHHATCQNGKWTWPPRVDGVPPKDLDRDLVRVPLQFKRQPPQGRVATFENGQVVHPTTGFDSASGGGGGFDLRTAGAYEGNNYVQATYLSGTSSPHGTINLPGWVNGTEVWYGSAFFITNGFAASHSDASILEWSNAFKNRTGGINLGSDHQWRLVRGSQTLGSTFTMPEGQWIWLEVHQRLSQTNPISEVYVNGRLVSSSAAVNNYPDIDGAPVWLRVGFVRLSGTPSALFVDRVSVWDRERGPLARPDTPIGFHGTEQDRFVTIAWKQVLGAEGYRIYKQQSNGTWAARFDHKAPAGGTFETGLDNCPATPYRYRIAAYNSQGVESVASEPLELLPRAGSAGCP